MPFVTLYTRVWIEISWCILAKCFHTVTLYTRVWIEIWNAPYADSDFKVTLYTRVWIEIEKTAIYYGDMSGHPLHEGVD